MRSSIRKSFGLSLHDPYRQLGGEEWVGEYQEWQGEDDMRRDSRKSRKSSGRTAFLAALRAEWETITSLKAIELHTVTKYRSRHTGLTVVHANVKGPEVYGYVVFRK